MTFKIAIILPLHKNFFCVINIVVQTNTQKNLTRSFDWKDKYHENLHKRSCQH